jgi:hypothetical protein
MYFYILKFKDYFKNKKIIGLGGQSKVFKVIIIILLGIKCYRWLRLRNKNYKNRF